MPRVEDHGGIIAGSLRDHCGIMAGSSASEFSINFPIVRRPDSSQKINKFPNSETTRFFANISINFPIVRRPDFRKSSFIFLIVRRPDFSQTINPFPNSETTRFSAKFSIHFPIVRRPDFRQTNPSFSHFPIVRRPEFPQHFDIFPIAKPADFARYRSDRVVKRLSLDVSTGRLFTEKMFIYSSIVNTATRTNDTLTSFRRKKGMAMSGKSYQTSWNALQHHATAIPALNEHTQSNTTRWRFSSWNIIITSTLTHGDSPPETT